MNKFEDLFESKIEIEESKDDQVLARIRFPWGRADTENKNKRTYPFEIFKTAIEKLSEKIKRAYVPGTLDHPLLGGATRLGDVSHILKSVWLKDKTAYAEADILKTSKGKDVLAVIKSGVAMGASLRGFGEVKNGKVQKGLEIASVDLVANPSFGQDAQVGIHNICLESTILEPGVGELSFEEKKMAGVGREARIIAEKLDVKIDRTDSRLYEEYMMAGGKESFVNWKKLYGGDK
jgi:hypothetical protein